MGKFLYISSSLYPVEYIKRFERCNISSIIIGFDKKYVDHHKDDVYSFCDEKEATKIIDEFINFINDENLYGVFKINKKKSIRQIA